MPVIFYRLLSIVEHGTLTVINMRQIPFYDKEALSLYKSELMKIYKQLGFEILIFVLLLACIQYQFLIKSANPIIYFVASLVLIKACFTADSVHLIKRGKVTFLKVEEFDNIV